MIQKGFTLSEVLITLGVIGVVAALTIPTLTNNSQKTTYLAQLKKNYSQFSEALKLLSNDMGCPDDLKCTTLFTSDADNESLGTEISKYFKVIKNCGTVSGQGCLATNANTYYDGSGGEYNLDDGSGGMLIGNYNFITADGASYSINNFANDCVSGGIFCGEITMDVNGPNKGPNNYGRDIFNFYISSGKGGLIYPIGGPNDTTSGWYSESGSADDQCKDDNRIGWLCAARIIKDGWQMNY